MKKKELEIMLQKVPSPNRPILRLEQYMTPANISADIIFIAHQFGDIENKTVIDLGCGTGIFSVGAYIAGAKKVTGVDIDKESIAIATSYAKKSNMDIEFLVCDVKDIQTNCNTVVMNPPFGAQKSNEKADRKFIEKGFEIAEVIYSLHLKKTIPFLEKMINSLGGYITYWKEYEFPIKRMFRFHNKEIVNYNVTLLKIDTGMSKK